MNEIILITNDDKKLQWHGVVSNGALKCLEKLQKVGGFLRFNLSLIDDKAKGKNTYGECAEWMNKNVFNK